jgi:hypothetical protein
MNFRKYLAELEQKYKSAGTSINSSKLPATFGRLEKANVIQPGMVIADLGGGKFDNAIQWAEQKQAKLYVIDPYNRTPEYNNKSIEAVKTTGADIVLINNVLNVIAEVEVRKELLNTAKSYLKNGGKCFILIYEGDSSGVGKETQKGSSWQNNQKTATYLAEVQEVFGSAVIKMGLIVAEKK